VDDSFGSLTPGKQGDLAVFRVPRTARPEETLLEHAPATAEAVLAAGIWRVREGRSVIAT
jgi:imidazolonepropionase-like amidohydrolase